MKSYKPLFSIVLMLALLVSLFASTLNGQAQGEQDWSAPVNLSLSGVASNPVMVVDARGTIHAIWVDDVDGYKYAQSADGGATWTPAVSVKFPFDPKDPPPVILSDPNGVIHLFWMSRDSGVFYGQALPIDFGIPGNWLTVSRLASDVLTFDVTLDAWGRLHLAYIRKATSVDNPSGVYYRNTNAGGGWMAAVKLYESEYFRSAKPNEAYLRIASSNPASESTQSIYVTWDNRAQKRVYMAVSTDSGVNWGEARQIKGPEDTGGIDSPFNLSVAALNQKVLLTWQVGDPGSAKCTLYSQWSTDGGNSWEDAVAVLGGRSDCPLGAKFVSITSDYMVLLLPGEVSPTLVAWDGEQWSDIQSQIQLPSFSNPLTYDAVLLGCRFDLINNDHLYVAGCDQGRGGDVWFLSRSLESVENWFSPSSVWGEPVLLSIESENSEDFSYFSSSADKAGNVHMAWVKSLSNGGTASDISIEYAQWDGKQWSNPDEIMSSLANMPIYLSVTADPLDRLLLTMIDGYNGDLVFSWANLENVRLASEWGELTGLPSPSRLIGSSDVVVDGSGRIFIVYVAPVNENRGVYLVQSDINGSIWETPIRVFDAISEGWERIEQPRMSLGTDGVLHLVFVRSTVRVGQPVGLYYSHSSDGGLTWSGAQLLSEGDIQWADVVSDDDQVVHVVWQEFDGLVFANISQVSQDGGLTWGKQNNVTGVNDGATKVALASNGNGLLHFIQLLKKNDDNAAQFDLTVQDWQWDGRSWNLELTKDFAIKGNVDSYSLSANITSTGFLGVFVPVEYTNSSGKLENEIVTFSRYLEGTEGNPAKDVAIVPTVAVQSNGNETFVVQPTSTPDFSILYDDNVSTSPFERNLIGLVLIVVGVIVTVVLLVWRRPANK